PPSGAKGPDGRAVAGGLGQGSERSGKAVRQGGPGLRQAKGHLLRHLAGRRCQRERAAGGRHLPSPRLTRLDSLTRGPAPSGGWVTEVVVLPEVFDESRMRR